MENLGRGGAAGSHYSMLVFLLSMLDPAVSVANCSGLVSARLWSEINTMDKAIKALFVPFVTTGWELKQSVFYQCQRCDETWLTQEANGVKVPICQPSSRPDWSNRRRTEFLEKSKKVFSNFIFSPFKNRTGLELQDTVKKNNCILTQNLRFSFNCLGTIRKKVVTWCQWLRCVTFVWSGFSGDFGGLKWFIKFSGDINHCCFSLMLQMWQNIISFSFPSFFQFSFFPSFSPPPARCTWHF